MSFAGNGERALGGGIPKPFKNVCSIELLNCNIT